MIDDLMKLFMKTEWICVSDVGRGSGAGVSLAGLLRYLCLHPGAPVEGLRVR